METTRRHLALALSIAVLGTLATSCVTPPAPFKTVDMTEQEDIPVPKNFELRHSYSPDWKFDAPEARFRSWTGEYGGIAQIGELVPWYIVEMRNHKWQYRGIEEEGSSVKRLYFEKGDEVSKVEISRRIEPRDGGYLTIVRAEVHPRGPEEFTVDEHLRQKEAGIRPASFSRAREEGSAGEPDASEPEAVPAVEEGQKKAAHRGDTRVKPDGDAREDDARGDARGASEDAQDKRSRKDVRSGSKGETEQGKAGGTKGARRAGEAPKEIQELEEAARPPAE